MCANLLDFTLGQNSGSNSEVETEAKREEVVEDNLETEVILDKDGNP